MKNNKQKHLLSFLMCSLFFASCIGFNVDIYSGNTTGRKVQKRSYPANGWKKIKIYEEGELNSMLYDVISSIEVVANRTASEKKLLRKMREEAGCYRADAIIIES